MKRQQKDMDSWRDIIEAAGLPSDMRVEGGAISAYLRTCDGHGQDNLMEKLASIMRDEKKKLQKSMEETFVVSSNKTKSRDASMLQENLIASEDEHGIVVLDLANDMKKRAAAMNRVVSDDIEVLKKTSEVQNDNMSHVEEANKKATSMFGNWSWMLFRDIFFVTTSGIVFFGTLAMITSTIPYAARHTWWTRSLEVLLWLVSVFGASVALYGVLYASKKK
eukprot:GHVH01007663.1.p1 GENE.GHVH01007663.1~~GHVH01007663.1.p1  ORF type:complete len:221 (+),score=36.75 GHVH01007663.1:16-678(+)